MNIKIKITYNENIIEIENTYNYESYIDVGDFVINAISETINTLKTQ